MTSKELVDVKSFSKKPQAVVILLGWMEAKQRHLSKYTELYHKRSCSTVVTTASTPSIMLGNEATISALALTVSLEAVRLIKEAELSNPELGRVPLIVHAFSNGGVFVLEQLEKHLQEAKIGYPTNTTKRSSIGLGDFYQDLLILSQRLEVGCQIFDSAPAYLHHFSGVRAIGSSVSNPLLRIILMFAFLVYVTWGTIFKLVMGGSNRKDEFWTNMEESDVALRQVFIYSTSDEITDAEKLDELVETRKTRGFHLTVVKFDDSSHVQHLRKHKREYEHTIDQVLNAICCKKFDNNSPGL